MTAAVTNSGGRPTLDDMIKKGSWVSLRKAIKNGEEVAAHHLNSAIDRAARGSMVNVTGTNSYVRMMVLGVVARGLVNRNPSVVDAAVTKLENHRRNNRAGILKVLKNARASKVEQSLR